MSESSSALFTGDLSPLLLPSSLHRVGNDVIQLVGGVSHGTNRTEVVGSLFRDRLSGLRRRPERAKVFPHGFGNESLFRCKMPAEYFRPDRAFQILGQMN